MVKYWIVLCLTLTCFQVAFSQQQLPYKNPALPIDERVKDLLSRMTPEEKFWQLYMIPGDLDHATTDQYKNGIFGFQVSASSKGKEETQQILSYNTNETGLVLAQKNQNQTGAP